VHVNIVSLLTYLLTKVPLNANQPTNQPPKAGYRCVDAQ